MKISMSRAVEIGAFLVIMAFLAGLTLFAYLNEKEMRRLEFEAIKTQPLAGYATPQSSGPQSKEFAQYLGKLGASLGGDKTIKITTKRKPLEGLGETFVSVEIKAEGRDTLFISYSLDQWEDCKPQILRWALQQQPY